MKKGVLTTFAAILICVITFSSCDLGENSVRYDVYPNITNWNLPDTASVNVPFDVYIESGFDNTCVKNLSFSIAKNKDFEYFVWATATFENHGEECLYKETIVDTSYSVSLTKVGKHYFYFKFDSSPKLDSIYIKP